MTKELIRELAGKETGWCLCSTPDLQIMNHITEALAEKIVERVVRRCAQVAETWVRADEGSAPSSDICRKILLEAGLE